MSNTNSLIKGHWYNTKPGLGLSNAGNGKRGKILGTTTPKKVDEGTTFDHLHRLNQNNISAWNMKRLMHIVRKGTLATLDKQLEGSRVYAEDESAVQITDEMQAKVAAKKIFINVAKQSSKRIYLADLMHFLREDEALKAIGLFDVESESQGISKRALKNWVVNVFRERKALALSLDDTKIAVKKLHQMFNVAVGDRCEVDSVQLVVEEMNILTTSRDDINFSIHVSTPVEKVSLMKQRITSYVENKSEHWHPAPSILVRDVEDLNRVKISVWLFHRMNFQNMLERWKRRGLLVEEMIKIFKDLNIEYRRLPVDINLKDLETVTLQNFEDTANNGQKKAMVFYHMDTKEVSDRFVAPCFVNGMEAYDGEINLGVEENMILNEYVVKLCLEHEVKRGNKVVKKELIVSLRSEIYFVKLIINPEDYDVDPEVIIGRSFLQLIKAIIDLRARTVTIYPDIDPFLEETEEEGKRNDDWDHLLDFIIDDIPLLGTSSTGGHLTQEEAAKEAIAIRMIWKDKAKLDGKIVKEEEEDVKRIKGEALKEKEDPGVFIFPIILEGQKVDKGITMINHTQAEAMGILTNVLCQVGVTTFIAKFLILDIHIDHDSPIVIGRGFLLPLKPVNWKPDYKGSYTKEEEATCQWQTEIRLTDPYGNTMGINDDEAGSSRSKCSRHETVEEVLLLQVHHEFLLWEGCNRDAKSRSKVLDLFSLFFFKCLQYELPEDVVSIIFGIILELQHDDFPGAYNPPGYAKPQYDQYYQQYSPSPP
ncbi:hypothetical protein Tco_0504796 [Tanacetum coccineum]